MFDEFGETSKAKSDFVVAVIAAVVLFVLASVFDLYEDWVAWTGSLEHWEVDEIPIALSLASVAFAWYAYRRWQENLQTARRLAVINDQLKSEVEDRNRAQKALEESEERYRRLVEMSPNAIAVQIDGRFGFANPAAARLFGVASAEALIGTPVLDLVDPACRETVAARLRNTLKQGVRTEVELTLLRPDGQSFPAKYSFTPIVLEDRSAVLSVFDDLTDLKVAEQAMCEAAELAESANRAKSDFLANMSHELRSPLNSILGFAQMIREPNAGGPDAVDQREFAGHIHSAGEHLLSLINDILDLSKAESGKLELREDSVDLGDIIGSCLILIAERAHTGGVKLKSRVAGDLPFLRADPRKLKQVLINLLDNAVKFTPPGGRITVVAHHEPEAGYELRVTDTGVGIEPHMVSRAMERFGQVDSGPSRGQSGTGLGLPLTKALIELHGGSMELSSRSGEGTTVVVRLPDERALLKRPCRPAARKAG